MIDKIKYYWKLIKWLYKNKDCPNNRAKWRRLDREIGEEVKTCITEK